MINLRTSLLEDTLEVSVLPNWRRSFYMHHDRETGSLLQYLPVHDLNAKFGAEKSSNLTFKPKNFKKKSVLFKTVVNLRTKGLYEASLG